MAKSTDRSTMQRGPWQDATLSTVQRVEALLSAMTLEEKVGQLGSYWAHANVGEGDVAPMASEMADGDDDFAATIANGLGHLTRVFGTAPVSVEAGTADLLERQRQVMSADRFGINHVVGAGDDLGLPIQTILHAVREEFAESEVLHVQGCDIDSDDLSGIAEAVKVAADSEMVVLVVGDRAGLFGRGTSGEGCDRPDLALRGMQAHMVREVLATGVPVVLVVVSGRTYALGDFARASAAMVQAFFPGVEGGSALAGVLSGRVNPSGRLPIGIPEETGGQPVTYRAAALGRLAPGVSTLDPTALFPFGHGLSYSAAEYLDIRTSDTTMAVDGSLEVTVTLRGVGQRGGAEVVQLYLSDLQGQVARPVVELIGFARIDLEPGRRRHVRFTVDADRLSFTGIDRQRVVEPGAVRFSAGGSSEDLPLRVEVDVVGPLRRVDGDRGLVYDRIDRTARQTARSGSPARC